MVSDLLALGTGNRHNYNSTCDEDEFMVAADFTLYSNPINKMLYRPGQQTAVSSASASKAPASQHRNVPASAAEQKGDDKTVSVWCIN